MASSWRSLLKEKIHSVLSSDKEIKEQFIGRWQLTRDRLEQKVPHERCTIKRQRNKGAISLKMTRDRAEGTCMWHAWSPLVLEWLEFKIFPGSNMIHNKIFTGSIMIHKNHNRPCENFVVKHVRPWENFEF